MIKGRVGGVMGATLCYFYNFRNNICKILKGGKVTPRTGLADYYQYGRKEMKRNILFIQI